MRVSPTDYKDATRVALYIVCFLYGVAGLLVGTSTRRIDMTGWRYIAAIVASLVICNMIIRIYQQITLPKIQAQLKHAIETRDGQGFARHIIRQEMAKIFQPIGGIAFTIGFLIEIILSRLIVSHAWL